MKEDSIKKENCVNARVERENIKEKWKYISDGESIKMLKG